MELKQIEKLADLMRAKGIKKLDVPSGDGWVSIELEADFTPDYSESEFEIPFVAE